MRRIETWAASPWGKTSRRTSCASSTVIGRPVSEENATTRVSAPSSSRMFVETRPATKVRTWASSTSIPSAATFLRRIAIRVSRSGGWMSVISPPPNRERGRVREAVRGADDERVEGVLRIEAALALLARRLRRRGGRLAGPVGDGEADAAFLPGRIAGGGADQAEEVALDPLAREVVR